MGGPGGEGGGREESLVHFPEAREEDRGTCPRVYLTSRWTSTGAGQDGCQPGWRVAFLTITVPKEGREGPGEIA